MPKFCAGKIRLEFHTIVVCVSSDESFFFALIRPDFPDGFPANTGRCAWLTNIQGASLNVQYLVQSGSIKYPPPASLKTQRRLSLGHVRGVNRGHITCVIPGGMEFSPALSGVHPPDKSLLLAPALRSCLSEEGAFAPLRFNFYS